MEKNPKFVYLLGKAQNNEVVVIRDNETYRLPGGELGDSKKPWETAEKLWRDQTGGFFSSLSCLSKPAYISDNGEAWYFSAEDILHIPAFDEHDPSMYEFVKDDFFEKHNDIETMSFNELSKYTDFSWLNSFDEKILSGESINQLFYEAARNVLYDKETIENVEKLLQQGADVNYTHNESGDLPIVFAARFGKTELLKLLLKHGASINRMTNRNNDSSAAIMDAVMENKIECFDILAKHNADIHILDNMKNNLIHYVFMNKQKMINMDLLTSLIESGLDVNHQNKFGSTPLMFAVERRAKNINAAILMLLDNGADIDIATNNGKKAVDFIDDSEKGQEILSVINSYREFTKLKSDIDNNLSNDYSPKF